MSALLSSDNPFDLVQGLPAHPLVVHAAVVLFPLALVGLLGILVSRALRERLGWVVMVLLAVGALTIPLAKETGEALANHVGKPRDHAQYADYLVVTAFATVILAFCWWLLDRLAARRAAAEAAGTLGSRDARPGRPPLRGVLGLLAGLLALASMGLTVAVGHTGATATWKGEVASWAAPAAAAATPGAGTSTAPATATTTPGDDASSSAPAASSSTASGYTMATVGEHATSTSCWTAIDGTVYDLTTWIAAHPGGPGPIQSLCGKDGTAAFMQKHGDDAKPREELASLKIGTLQP